MKAKSMFYLMCLCLFLISNAQLYCQMSGLPETVADDEPLPRPFLASIISPVTCEYSLAGSSGFSGTTFLAPGDWINKGEHSWRRGRHMHAMAYTGEGKILLFGGHSGYHLSDSYIYNPERNQWQQLTGITPHPSDRFNHAMAYIGDDKVLLFGGYNDRRVMFSDTWLFDLSDGNWTELTPANAPSARASHAMVYMGDDKVMLFGGLRGGSNFNNETWIFDLSENSWTLIEPPVSPRSRFSHSMARIGNQKAMLFGGIDRITGAAQSCQDTWIFDFETRTWTEMAPENKPDSRFGHAMATLGGTRAVLFGGYGPVPGDFGTIKQDTWIYDLSNDSWIEQNPVIHPPALFEHAMAESGLNGGDVVLFGGNKNYNPQELYSNTWTFENPEITLTILTPNGGESLEAGSDFVITWMSPGFLGGMVDIEISTDGGSTWTVLADNTPDDGSETITVPDISSEDCLIRITDSDGSQADMSDSVFAIVPVREKICFPPHGGVPGIPGPPVIDGSIADDLGWRGASRRVYGSGTEPANVIMQTLSNRNEPYLYLSLEINNDPSFDSRDVIVLNFRSNAISGQPEDDRRIFIFPLTDNCGAGSETCDPDAVEDRSNVSPRSISIWSNSNSWTEVDPSTLSNFQFKANSSIDGTSVSWTLEAQIPTTKISGGADWIDLSDEFLFYSNVIRVTGPADFGTEFRFPRNAPEINGEITDYIFNPLEWGIGLKGTSSRCKGVWVTWNSVGTDNIPSSAIQINSATHDFINHFFANVYNNTEEGETPVAAQDVNVLFRLANWGIPGPGQWSTIPADNPGCISPNTTSNPSCPHDIPAASGTTPGMYPFKLDYVVPEDMEPYYRDHSHQCILVELDSRSDIDFITKSIYRNMDFVEASRFAREAEIGSKGYGTPLSGSDYHQFFLHLVSKSIPTDKKTEMTQKDPTVSRLRLVTNGYRINGHVIIIDGKQYNLSDPAGSFGYIVTHNGPVVKWKTSLRGANEVSNQIYSLNVPRDTTVKVETIIQPVETSKWSYSLHAGLSSPSGNFANYYKSGMNFMIDIDYHLSDTWALTALAGYNRFMSQQSGLSDVDWWNTSVNLRWYRSLGGNISLYIGAGPGAYFSKGNTNETGLNTGMGFNYKLLPYLQLELGTDYHSCTGNLQFVQTHLGIVGRF